MIIKRFFSVFLIFGTFVFAKTINVAVAANASYAIVEIVKEFNRIYPDIKVQVILASSGKLTAQIRHGADISVFMSANMQYPQALFKEHIATLKPVVYAKGALVLLSTKKRDFSKGMELLNDKNIKVIAMANPKTAPYGMATKEAMRNSGVYEKIKNKIIYAESISQTLSYTMMASDVGFIAKSALYSPKMRMFKEGINWSDVDTKLYTPISQGIIMLKKDKETKLFYDFVLSTKTKKIFKKFGYRVL